MNLGYTSPDASKPVWTLASACPNGRLSTSWCTQAPPRPKPNSSSWCPTKNARMKDGGLCQQCILDSKCAMLLRENGQHARWRSVRLMGCCMMHTTITLTATRPKNNECSAPRYVMGHHVPLCTVQKACTLSVLNMTRWQCNQYTPFENKHSLQVKALLNIYYNLTHH